MEEAQSSEPECVRNGRVSRDDVSEKGQASPIGSSGRIMFMLSAREATERYQTGKNMLWFILVKFSLEAVTSLDSGEEGKWR